MTDSWLHHYQGNGTKHERPLHPLPPLNDDPSLYLAGPKLRTAVNVALALDLPLLVTGQPGTGKTELAASVAWELGLPLFTFQAKTTSTARDVFYRYDALRHFHAAHFQKNKARALAKLFIEMEALGKAILSGGPPKASDYLAVDKPTRSVVLIDEIDKAPRDFPNDLLTEIDKMCFRIYETGEEFQAPAGYRPILIITSNRESILPDAFLRRCLFHYIDPPDEADLRKIVQQRLGRSTELLDHAIRWFIDKRETLDKHVSTAEFLHWARLLDDLQIDVASLKEGEAEILAVSYAALAKSPEDAKKLTL